MGNELPISMSSPRFEGCTKQLAGVNENILNAYVVTGSQP